MDNRGKSPRPCCWPARSWWAASRTACSAKPSRRPRSVVHCPSACTASSRGAGTRAGATSRASSPSRIPISDARCTTRVDQQTVWSAVRGFSEGRRGRLTHAGAISRRFEAPAGPRGDGRRRARAGRQGGAGRRGRRRLRRRPAVGHRRVRLARALRPPVDEAAARARGRGVRDEPRRSSVPESKLRATLQALLSLAGSAPGSVRGNAGVGQVFEFVVERYRGGRAGRTRAASSTRPSCRRCSALDGRQAWPR